MNQFEREDIEEFYPSAKELSDLIKKSIETRKKVAEQTKLYKSFLVSQQNTAVSSQAVHDISKATANLNIRSGKK